MNKQDVLKLQPCVLRVNIQCDCEGCHQKVKKALQKIDGVDKVNVDVELGKVTVLGNVDSEILIKKLEKVGKHAELWGGGQKGQIPNLNDQFKKSLIENAIGGKDGNKSQKMQQGGFLALNNKGAKIDSKKYKPLMPEDDEEEGDDDEFDDEDGYDDDGSEASFEHDDKPAIKLPAVPRDGGGHGPQVNHVSLNALVKDNNGSNNGGKGKKKGGGFDVFLKGMLGKAGGKKGIFGKRKGGNQDKGGDEKDGHVVKEGSKNGDKGEGDSYQSNGGGNEKDYANLSKKGGKNFDGFAKSDNEALMNGNHKGDIGLAGQNSDLGNFPMGQMGNFHAPPIVVPSMNGGGHFHGFGHGYPHHNQQYDVPWMMNQQPGYGQNMSHPLMHMRTHPASSYGPPPTGNDRYTNMFDNENANNCNIM